jgi:hypothetical protein
LSGWILGVSLCFRDTLNWKCFLENHMQTTCIWAKRAQLLYDILNSKKYCCPCISCLYSYKCYPSNLLIWLHFGSYFLWTVECFGRFWAHILMAYVFTFWTFYVLYHEYKVITTMRLRFLANQKRRPDQFTVRYLFGASFV